MFVTNDSGMIFSCFLEIPDKFHIIFVLSPPLLEFGYLIALVNINLFSLNKFVFCLLPQQHDVQVSMSVGFIRADRCCDVLLIRTKSDNITLKQQRTLTVCPLWTLPMINLRCLLLLSNDFQIPDSSFTIGLKHCHHGRSRLTKTRMESSSEK
jgi:hypothetical protein